MGRDFRLFWASQAISDFGAMVTYVALPLVALLDLHATAFEVGLVAAAGNAAWLVFALPAGSFVDRVRRRPVLVAADLVRALALLTVPVAWALDALSIWHLVTVALITGTFEVLFMTAYTAFLPVLVPQDRLVEANGRIGATLSAAMIAGPGIGSLLVRLLGAPLALLAEAVSLFAAAAALLRIRVVEPVVERTAGGIVEGLRYVLRTPFQRTLVLAGTTANFCFGGAMPLLFVLLVREVGVAEGTVGVLLGVGAGGGLVGSLIAGWLARRFGDAVLTWTSTTLGAVGGSLVVATTPGPGLAWFVGGLFLANVGIAVFNVAVRAAVQTVTPPALIGRASASVRLFTRGVLPLGALAGGALATATSARLTLAVLFPGLLLAALVVLCSPLRRVRHLRDLPAAQNVRPAG